MADQTWIPDTVKTLLEKSEALYRSVNFKRTAHFMGVELQSADKQGTISADFFTRYISLLKDDCREFIGGFGFGSTVSEQFTASAHRSIDSVAKLLSGIDAEGKTPTFNGATSKKEDVEFVNRYISENGLFDPLVAAPDAYSALEMMDAFYEVVYNHVFIPGRDYIVNQLELVMGHEEMFDIAEAILSVNGIVTDGKRNVSDFRYAFEHPGSFTEDQKGWIIKDDVSVSVESIARWPLFMYYLVPIVTAILPIHNVIFFDLVHKNIEMKKAAGEAPSHP